MPAMSDDEHSENGSPDGTENPDHSPAESGPTIWQNPAYRFFAALILGSIALTVPTVREAFEPMTDLLSQWTAMIEYAFFSLFTPAISIANTNLTFKGFEVVIVEECTGIYEVFIYAAAVLAFPTSWLKKGIGLGAGIPFLYLINLLRIAVLLLVGHYQPDLFEFMHLYFWQVTLVVMILSVWLLWAKLIVASPRFE